MEFYRELPKAVPGFLFGGEKMVKINGQEVAAAGKTVTQYLTEEGYNLQRVAVERNGDILPKRCYDETVMVDGDCLEVVGFVGGG